MRAIHRWSCWVAAFTLLLIPGYEAVAANKYVVIAADPPVAALPLGRVLEVEDQIDVPAGAVLTLLGDDGTVTTIQGPEKLVVTEEPVSSSPEAIKTRTTFQRISDLLLGSSANADVLGASRSVGGSTGSNSEINPWAIAVEHPGDACISGTSLALQRSESLDEVALKVTVNGNLEIYSSNWAADKSNLMLPELGERQVKKLAVKFGDNISEFEVHILPDEIEPKRGMDILAWMLENKCTVQALRLARSLSQSLALNR